MAGDLLLNGFSYFPQHGPPPFSCQDTPRSAEDRPLFRAKVGYQDAPGSQQFPRIETSQGHWPLPYSSARGRAARKARLRVAASASTTNSTAKQRIVRCT